MQNRVLFPTIALAALLVSTSAGAAASKPPAREPQSSVPATPLGPPIRSTLTDVGTLGLGLALGLFGVARMRRARARSRHPEA